MVDLVGKTDFFKDGVGNGCLCLKFCASNERVCHGREGTKLDFFLRLCLLLPGPPFDSAFQRLADGCPKGNQLRSHPNPPERLGFHAGVQCFMPSDRVDPYHAYISLLLQVSSHFD